MEVSALRKHLASIPKAELHAHLEGSVSFATLSALAERGGIDLCSPVAMGPNFKISPPKSILTGYSAVNNFDDFIGVYLKISECIRDADDVAFVARQYLETAREESVQYAELYFSPSTFALLGYDLKSLFAGLARAQEIAAADYKIKLRWIFDIVRNVSKDGFEIIDNALRAKEAGVDVYAIGLAGDERKFPVSPFVPAFKKARALGFQVLAHAGETAGAQSMLEALELIDPARIGHGLAATKDANLLNQLKKKQTAIEVCPCGNVRLNICSAAEHPLSEMLGEDLNIVIGSDDPGIFEASLVDNYLLAHEMGVELKVLERLAARSLELARSC